MGTEIQEKFKRFILDDIFWFNKSELNFGIYKIFRQKEQVIKDKLDEIVTNIENELSSSNDKAISELKNEIIEYIPPKKVKNISLDTLEDIEQAIQEYGNGDTDKLLAQLNTLKSQDNYNSTKVYEYLYQFFHLYYEKGDFGYTPRSFRSYTVPYRYEEYLLEDQERCSSESSHTMEYKGEETLFTWKTKESYYIKSNKFLNSVSLNLEYNDKTYTIHTNILAKDEDIKDDKKVKQYRLVSIKKEKNTLTLNFHISDHATPKHTLYLMLLSVMENNISEFHYDAVFKDKRLKEYCEHLPFEDKKITASLLDATQQEVLLSFRELIQDDKRACYTLDIKYDQDGNVKSMTNIFKSELSGEEDKTQLKSKISKLMLEKKKYASTVYTKASAKEFLGLEKKAKFEFEDKKDLEALYKKDKELNFFYRLDRGINMFYAGVDSDYFIHKNLKRFLTVELDKFIKNYIFADTDALLLMDESAKRVATFARVFKSQAKVFIDLLSSIEEFQKYLWEKRKMIKRSHYVISSNKIKDGSILEEVLKNRDQLDEWERLGITKPNEKPNIIELQTYSYPIDTKHFTQKSQEFTYKVLSLFENIEEELSGLLIKSENYQALRFLEPKYTTKKGEGKIKCVYIDPPYNTGNDGFVYKDNFKTASWLSMMSDRLKVAKTLMRDDGVIFDNIGKDERNHLELIHKIIFNEDNFIDMLPREQKSGSDQGNYFAPQLDYIIASAKNKEKLQKFQTLNYNEKTEKSLYQSSLDPLRGCKNQRYWIKCPDGSFIIPIGENYPSKIKDGSYIEPKNESDKVWRWSYTSYLKQKDRLVFKETSKSPLVNENFEQSKWNVYVKVDKDTENMMLPRDYIFSIKDKKCKNILNMTNSSGSKILSDMNISFDNPKPTTLIEYLISLSTFYNYSNINILDFFAGSGTTPHAVINLNREDGGKRKFIAVEMNDYFETIILPRIKKVSFASSWKDGKPQNKDGYSGIFQYIELEQYDDIIDNLQVEDNENIDYNSVDVSYIYEPDKNQINFRMENELKDPLNPNNRFDIFTSLLFHEALELINIKLEDDVLVATVKDKYKNICAVVLSNHTQKAKEQIKTLNDDFYKVYSNIFTTESEHIIAETFKGK